LTMKVMLAWSGGKDSALALLRLQQDPQVELVGLLTTFTTMHGRVPFHGVRRVMVEAQADAIGLPLCTVWLPPQANNARYERGVQQALRTQQRSGLDAVAFGDLFLQDLRDYRERMIAPTELTPLFPLWGLDSQAVAEEIVASGIRATVVGVDPTRVPSTFLGRPYDEDFLHELPPGVDPCGENGEFHTFVHDGPAFASPLPVVLGVQRDWQGHRFAELLPVARHRQPA